MHLYDSLENLKAPDKEDSAGTHQCLLMGPSWMRVMVGDLRNSLMV